MALRFLLPLSPSVPLSHSKSSLPSSHVFLETSFPCSISQVAVFSNSLSGTRVSCWSHKPFCEYKCGISLCVADVSKRLAFRTADVSNQVAFRKSDPERKLRTRVKLNASGVENSPVVDSKFDIRRLEAYTEKVQKEVLLVHAEVEGEEDEVLIFKGYSSSIMRPTATDPAEPVLPEDTKIVSIDRIRAPYNPSNVQYLVQGVKWDEFLGILQSKGL